MKCLNLGLTDTSDQLECGFGRKRHLGAYGATEPYCRALNPYRTVVDCPG
jgi:hypothetical protein